MLGLAEDTGTTAIVFNAVRYGEPEDAAHMNQVARMVVDAGARTPDALDLLFRTTRELADRCALDPAADLGLGTPRMPEASIIGVVGDPVAEL